MVCCCVPLCKASGRTTSGGVAFHEFPVTDVRNQWLKKISRQADGPEKQPWVPNDRSVVCSLHFKPEDYREGLKLRRLKPDAVPSIFPGYPTYLQPAPKKERRPLKRKAATPASAAGKPPVDAKKNRLDTYTAGRTQVQDTTSMGVAKQLPNVPVAGSPESAQETDSPEPARETDSREPAQEPDCRKPAKEPLLFELSQEPSLETSQESPLELLPDPSSIPSVQRASVPVPPFTLEFVSKPPSMPPNVTRTRGIQTRLSLPLMSKLVNQVKTLTRKCQRLQKSKAKLQEEVSALRQQAKKTEALMKKAKFTLLQEKVEDNDAKALFIQEQLTFLDLSKGRWREETIRNCVLWHAKSPSGYRLLRETGVLSLPSRSTLKRYIGACTGEVVTSLIKQRLHAEAKQHSGQALCGSLVMDEMSVKQVTTYQKQSDAVHGLVDLGGAEADFGLQDQLATHLLCFVFVGLSTHYRLPVGYYFTKGLTGEQLQLLGLKVMQSVEEAGFEVKRLVGDNHSSNCKFFSSLSGGPIQPVVTHPLDPDRQLYLSFDYCHILKNIRSQFLEVRRLFKNNGTFILPDFLRRLYNIQETQGAFKLVRCLTRKHLWPSNFEKMNVGRAIAIFSPQVTSVLRFLQQHGHRLGAPGFENCLPTVEFMELVYKWFVLHNIKSTTLHWSSRDAMRMPFYGTDDERLSWLETECLDYFETWKQETTHKLQFLSQETYEALRVTTKSTVLCTRHLLDSGFHFVLTAKFSSDDVESLFSTIRQLNGSNDQTDAYAALSALQKILVTGIIHSSASGNVGSVVGSLGEATKLPPLPSKQATTVEDLGKLVLPYLPTLERYPGAPQQSLRSSTLALIAGFLVRAIQDNIDCEGCLVKLQAPTSRSTTTALIAGIDRGGLSYPTSTFVGFISHLESAASSVAPVLVTVPQPLKKFVNLVLPAVVKNPLFECSKDKTVSHRMALLNIILRKFMRPFLSNFTSKLTETQAKRKRLNSKPMSRKVLKV
ncbi:uncharacterized protein ISCGN_020974 [Ixodes scapularis]